VAFIYKDRIMAVLELNKDNFDETIQKNDIVILDFWAKIVTFSLKIIKVGIERI
jgi:dihydropteroate synthase